MKALFSSLALTLSLAFVPAAEAQHQAFTVNPDSSEVRIELKTSHDVVNGAFHVQSGAIEYDRKASSIGGSVVVAAGSGKTGNDSRDKKMNKEVLKIDQFATISFAPKSFTGTIAQTGDSTIQVAGVFTLLGAPHDLTIPMQIHIDRNKCNAKAHFTVPYVQWGLKNPSFLMFKADSQVDVDLNLAGQLSDR